MADSREPGGVRAGIGRRGEDGPGDPLSTPGVRRPYLCAAPARGWGSGASRVMGGVRGRRTHRARALRRDGEVGWYRV